MPLVDIQRVVCNVFIFSEISELLWEGSTKGKALMYSLIISWHSLDGAAAWEDASFSVFHKAMECSFELIDTIRDSLHPPTLDIQCQLFSVATLFYKPEEKNRESGWKETGLCTLGLL